MEVQVEKPGPCQARVSFSVSPQEFAAEVERSLRNLSKRVRMKGFRPGKVPAQILRREFGDEARHHAKEHFLRDALKRAIEDHSLELLDRPHVHLEELEVSDENGFSHTLDLNLRPEIELGEYKGMEVERRPVEVTDEEVENAIEDIRGQRARPEPAGEEGLQEEGMAVCKVQILHGEEVLHERDGMRLGVKTAPQGVDPEAYEKAMTGIAKDADLDLPITFPDTFEPPELRGQQGSCRVHVNEVYRIVRPEESELFELLEVQDGEGLRAKVREKIVEAKEQQEELRIEGELMEQLLGMHEVDLPDSVVEAQVRGRLESQRQNLMAQGMDEAEATTQVEQERGAAREASERSLRALFLIDSIARVENLGVRDEDILAELREIAERNQTSVEEVRSYYEEQKLFGQMAMELLERKVRRFLRESATISAPA